MPCSQVAYTKRTNAGNVEFVLNDAVPQDFMTSVCAESITLIIHQEMHRFGMCNTQLDWRSLISPALCQVPKRGEDDVAIGVFKNSQMQPYRYMFEKLADKADGMLIPVVVYSLCLPRSLFSHGDLSSMICRALFVGLPRN